MQFTSLIFLAFFSITAIIYFLIPDKLRWAWLLVCSYYFVMSCNPKYALLLATTTIITYLSGLLIGKANKMRDEERANKLKKLWVFLSFSSNLGILFLFKYYIFFSTNLERALHLISIPISMPYFEFLLPLGISFYTLQALSYTMDVYRNDVEPEKNLGKYALFVAFFPQIVAGPIEKSKNMLHQFSEKHVFDYDRVKNGLLLMLWGVLVKLVIADRLAVLVNTVYASPSSYKGFSVLIAMLFFTFQIYFDFMSYSDMARGAAEVLGFKVTNNFQQPYFSKSIKEFWSRWHISLTSWFRDYLYIPLGGNRKGKTRSYCNIMIVFLVSGLWHGSTFNFIIWGGLHGFYQVTENILKPHKEKLLKALKINTEVFSFKLLQTVIVFILVNFAWVFFRADSFSNAKIIIKNSFYFNPWMLLDGSIYKLGLDTKDFFIAIIGIVLVFVVDMMRRKKSLRIQLAKQNLIFRWGMYLVTVTVIIVLGMYGPGFSMQQFIYTHF